MRCSPLAVEARAPEVLVTFLLRQEGEYREARRGDAEGEADAFVQHEGADGKAALLAQEAHGLVAPARGEERALPREAGELSHVLARELGDVVALGRDRAHEVELGACDPSGTIAIEEALRGERAQQPVGCRAREPGRGRDLARRDRRGGVGAHRTQHRADARDDLGSGARLERSIHVHIMDHPWPAFHIEHKH